MKPLSRSSQFCNIDALQIVSRREVFVFDRCRLSRSIAQGRQLLRVPVVQKAIAATRREGK